MNKVRIKKCQLQKARDLYTSTTADAAILKFLASAGDRKFHHKNLTLLNINSVMPLCTYPPHWEGNFLSQKINSNNDIHTQYMKTSSYLKVQQ